MSNLHILTADEQQAFDYPPTLSVEMRALCFAIDTSLDKVLNKLRTPATKVGFLLQYAYFKGYQRFFFMSRFREEDKEYAAKLLNLSTQKIDLSNYKQRLPGLHQKKILALLGYKAFDNDTYEWLKKETYRQAECQCEPKQAFTHLIHLLIQHKIEIPSYHQLAELITLVYAGFENALIKKLNKKLKKSDRKLLDPGFN